MSSRYQPQRSRELYEQQLKPIFQNYRPFIQLDDRNEFYLKMLHDQGLLESGKHLVDLGAGLSVFGPICHAHGMKVTLVDDFGGGGGIELGQNPNQVPLLEVFEKQLGLNILRQNFLEQPLGLADKSVDVVTCFHSLEHWHHSPKRLFTEIVRVLKPGGFLVLATPNAVNLRKRIYVLIGKSNFPGLKEWYIHGDPVFRGHVREPVIRDLRQLMEWNSLQVVGTHGRNFIGQRSTVLTGLPKPLMSLIARVSQTLLRFFPSLCSDIHVIGRKTIEV
jgi:SAM-dependent methyltransferase